MGGVSGTVTGRWAGSNRLQVQLEDGSTQVVESSTAWADDVGVGDTVELELDPDGEPVDWRPADPG